jgi:hypothetical protein
MVRMRTSSSAWWARPLWASFSARQQFIIDTVTQGPVLGFGLRF